MTQNLILEELKRRGHKIGNGGVISDNGEEFFEVDGMMMT
jgi:hypothetical protein